MKTLIICEKPTAAEKIATALSEKRPNGKKLHGVPYYEFKRNGKQIVVVPALGHLFTLKNLKPMRDYPVYEIGWVPTYEADRKAKRTKVFVEAIKELAKDATDYISACDYDLEGCLPSFEKIIVKRGGETRIETIGELVEKIFGASKTRQLNGFEFTEPSQDIYTPAIDPTTLRVEFKKIEKVMRRPNDGTILKITTKYGRVIHVSKNHPVLVLTSNGIQIKKAGELKAGEYLTVVKQLPPVQAIAEVDLIEELSKRGLARDYYVYGARRFIYKMPAEIAKLLSINRKTVLGWRFWDRMPLWAYLKLEEDKKIRNFLKVGVYKAKTKIPAIIRFDAKLGRLIGYYLAEGCTDTSGFIGFYFGEHEKDLADEVGDLFTEIFKIKPKKRFKKIPEAAFGKGHTWEVGTKSKIVKFLFELMEVGKNAHEKRPPKNVLSAPEEFCLNLIDAYLMGDGSAFVDRRKNLCVLSAGSVSQHLIEDLHILLLRFGINSCLVEGQGMYYLSLQSMEIKKLIHLGVLSTIARKGLVEFALKKRMRDRGDSLDLLPVFALSNCEPSDQQTKRYIQYAQRWKRFNLQIGLSHFNSIGGKSPCESWGMRAERNIFPCPPSLTKVGRGHPEPNAFPERAPEVGHPKGRDIETSVTARRGMGSSPVDEVGTWSTEEGKASAKRAPSRGREGVTRRKVEAPCESEGRRSLEGMDISMIKSRFGV